MGIEVIRSRRKTLSVEIREGRLLVRAPLRVSNAEISRFLQEKQAWIDKHLAGSPFAASIPAGAAAAARET